MRLGALAMELPKPCEDLSNMRWRGSFFSAPVFAMLFTWVLVDGSFVGKVLVSLQHQLPLKKSPFMG
jgi:hypothetical protein